MKGLPGFEYSSRPTVDKICFGRGGKRLTSYPAEIEARRGAWRIQKDYGIKTEHYHCDECGQFHTRPVECPHCTDSEGGPKYTYLTFEAAEKAADFEWKKAGVKLAVMECPHQSGHYHLTKDRCGPDVIGGVKSNGRHRKAKRTKVISDLVWAKLETA